MAAKSDCHILTPFAPGVSLVSQRSVTAMVHWSVRPLLPPGAVTGYTRRLTISLVRSMWLRSCNSSKSWQDRKSWQLAVPCPYFGWSACAATIQTDHQCRRRLRVQLPACYSTARPMRGAACSNSTSGSSVGVRLWVPPADCSLNSRASTSTVIQW